MKTSLLMLLGASLLGACDGGKSTSGAPAASSASATSSGTPAAATKLQIEAPEVGLSGDMVVAESWFSNLSAMFSDDTDGDRIASQATMVRVYLSDGPMKLGVPMQPGQHRIYFSLTGKKGTLAETALEPGNYDLRAKHFERVAELRLERATDDPKNPEMLVLTEATGNVRLLEHTRHRLSGEIDVRQGKMHIKGRFSAAPMPSGIMRRGEK